MVRLIESTEYEYVCKNLNPNNSAPSNSKAQVILKRVVSKNPAVVYRVVKNAKEVPGKCDEE